MNKYSVMETPGTVGAAVIRAGVLLQLSAALGGVGPYAELHPMAKYEIFEPARTSSATYGFHFVESLSMGSVEVDFEEEITAFYQKLQSSQESLGPAFEKVLAENRWDLYSKS